MCPVFGKPLMPLASARSHTSEFQCWTTHLETNDLLKLILRLQLGKVMSVSTCVVECTAHFHPSTVIGLYCIKFRYKSSKKRALWFKELHALGVAKPWRRSSPCLGSRNQDFMKNEIWKHYTMTWKPNPLPHWTNTVRMEEIGVVWCQPANFTHWETAGKHTFFASPANLRSNTYSLTGLLLLSWSDAKYYMPGMLSVRISALWCAHPQSYSVGIIDTMIIDILIKSHRAGCAEGWWKNRTRQHARTNSVPTFASC